jgi:hypothetical protein
VERLGPPYLLAKGIAIGGVTLDAVTSPQDAAHRTGRRCASIAGYCTALRTTRRKREIQVESSELGRHSHCVRAVVEWL